MKLPFRLGLVALGALLLGFAIGRFSNASSATITEEELHSVLLAHAALQTTLCTSLLSALRDGHIEPARDRLEANLDSALINLAREYNPARDTKLGAARAIRRARAYRAKYPRTSSIEATDAKVQAALALPVPASE